MTKLNEEEIFEFVMNRNKFLVDMHFSSLRDWISKCRITVKDFSRLLGVDRSHIHKIMSGVNSPSMDLMDKIKVLTAGKIRTENDLIEPF